MALDESNAGAETDTGGESAEAEASSQRDSDAQEAAAEPEAKTRVPVPPKKGRRAQAEAATNGFEKKLKDFQDSFSKKEQEWSGRDSQYSAEINRLRGQIDQMQTQGQQGAPRGPNPTDLMKEADAALQKGEYTEWREKYKEAIKLEVMASIPWNQFAQQRNSGGTDPRLQVVMNQNPEVMMHTHGYQMAVLEDQKLALQGYPDGPERWQKAFQIVGNAVSGGRTGQPQFSQQGRGALAGVPTQQQRGNQNGVKYVDLTPEEELWRKASGMTRDEYVSQILTAHPERARQD